MGFLRPMGDALTSPSRRLEDPLERGSARLLAACLVTMTFVFVCLDAFKGGVFEEYSLPWHHYAFLIGSYALSRTALYRWGVIATMVMFPAVSLSQLFIFGRSAPLVYAILSPFFAGLFLGFRGSVAMALFNPAWIALLPTLAPDIIAFKQIIDLFVANVLGGLLAVSYSLRRDWVEKRRLESQKLHEKQMLQMQKMEALGRMAGGIAHDFNNLLTVISGGIELMARDGASKELRLIDQATLSAQQLTSQLLMLSRQGVVERASADLQKMFQGVEGFLSRIIGEDIELQVRAEPETHAVALTQVQLQQILLNLATNARDAMPRGGVLEFTARNLNQDKVELVVRDSGEGMSDAVVSKMFEPFFTTKAVGKGTGLGLSMVFGLVAQSGGGIEVESQVGKGTTFRITLCRAEHDEEAPVSLSERNLDLRGRAKGRILLVEDDSDVRELCRSVLRREGYDVIDASHPDEALELFEECAGQLDLLLSDVVMPRMTGLELAALLREQDPELPMLFMSGYAPEQVTSEPLDGRLLLRKPFRPTELLRRVSAVVYGLESQPPPAQDDGPEGEQSVLLTPPLPQPPDVSRLSDEKISSQEPLISVDSEKEVIDETKLNSGTDRSR